MNNVANKEMTMTIMEKHVMLLNNCSNEMAKMVVRGILNIYNEAEQFSNNVEISQSANKFSNNVEIKEPDRWTPVIDVATIPIGSEVKTIWGKGMEWTGIICEDEIIWENNQSGDLLNLQKAITAGKIKLFVKEKITT